MENEKQIDEDVRDSAFWREHQYRYASLILEREIIFAGSLLALSVLAIRVDDPESTWAIFSAWGCSAVALLAALGAMAGSWLFARDSAESHKHRLQATRDNEPKDEIDATFKAEQQSLDTVRNISRWAAILSFVLLLTSIAFLLTFAAANLT